MTRKRIVLMFHGLGGNWIRMGPIANYCAERIGDAEFHALQGPVNLGTQFDPLFGWYNVTIEWAHYARAFLDKLGEPCELNCWYIVRNAHAIHNCQLDKICAVIGGA
jgi:predicted esterase